MAAHRPFLSGQLVVASLISIEVSMAVYTSLHHIQDIHLDKYLSVIFAAKIVVNKRDFLHSIVAF